MLQKKSESLDSLPESVSEARTQQESVFLRTVLKKGTYERLRDFAKHYSTGRGDWDFGVAIQILMDYYEDSQRTAMNDKLDLLISLAQPKEEEEKKEAKEFVELLGGNKVEKK